MKWLPPLFVVLLVILAPFVIISLHTFRPQMVLIAQTLVSAGIGFFLYDWYRKIDKAQRTTVLLNILLVLLCVAALAVPLISHYTGRFAQGFGCRGSPYLIAVFGLFGNSAYKTEVLLKNPSSPLIGLGVIWPLLIASVITITARVVPHSDKAAVKSYKYIHQVGEITFLITALYLWTYTYPWGTIITLFLMCLILALYSSYYLLIAGYKRSNPLSKKAPALLPLGLLFILAAAGFISFSLLLIYSKDASIFHQLFQILITTLPFLLGFIVLKIFFLLPKKYLPSIAIGILLLFVSVYSFEAITKTVRSKYTCHHGFYRGGVY